MWRFRIAHMPSNANDTVDAASRSPYGPTPLEPPTAHLASTPALIPEPDNSADENTNHTAPEASTITIAGTTVPGSDLAAAPATDDDYQELVQAASSNFPVPSRTARGATCLWRPRGRIRVRGGLPFDDIGVIVPVALCRRILESLHATHQGVSSMCSCASAIVCWPGIKDNIADTRANCGHCNTDPKTPMDNSEAPSTPIEAVAADYFHFAGAHYLITVN